MVLTNKKEYNNEVATDTHFVGKVAVTKAHHDIARECCKGMSNEEENIASFLIATSGDIRLVKEALRAWRNLKERIDQEKKLITV